MVSEATFIRWRLNPGQGAPGSCSSYFWFVPFKVCNLCNNMDSIQHAAAVTSHNQPLATRCITIIVSHKKDEL